MRRVGRIAAIVAAILMIAVFTVSFLQEKKEDQEKEADHARMESELRPMDLELRRLNQDLDSLEKGLEKEIQGMGTFALLFTNQDEILYTDIFPQMKDYGFIGVMTLSPNSFPGREGCLNREQFAELLNAGWKCALRWEDGMEAEEWMSSCEELFREFEMQLPECVYFPEDTYHSNINNFLTRNRFSMAVHHGEEELPLILDEAGEGIWYPGAMAWNQEGVISRMEEAIAQNGNMVFTVGDDSESEEYKKAGYTRMLDMLRNYCQSGDLLVTDILGAREYRRNLEAERGAIEADYESRRAQLEERIDSLNREMEAVRQRYWQEWEQRE